jgi:phosphonate transport system substrate-binding protein
LHVNNPAGVMAFLAVILVAFGVSSAHVSPARAQDCPRGDLDARYCDRDGDLVADTPTDPDELLDPKTIIFSYTPVEDPAVWAGIWDRFLGHFAKVVGRKVTFFQVQNYAAQLEALRSGRLHVAGVNAGSTPVAVNCAGFVPLVQMATPAGTWNYVMELIVPAASPVTQVEQLRGKTIAFVSPTSTSGFKAPVQLLEAEFGLTLDRDYASRFTGKHDTSIMGVANEDYEAAAVAGDLVRRMSDRGVLDRTRVRTIYTSAPFPGTAYGVINRLNPALVAKIRAAFMTYDWDDPKLRNEFPEVDRFVPTSYRTEFEIIRKIDASAGVKYDCR